jgi:hypothetical protein
MATAQGFRSPEPIIHLRRSVVDRLCAEVTRAFRSIPSQGMEIGGLLLGSADRHANSIEITDFAILVFKDRPDHRFVLSDSDRRTLEQTLANRGVMRNNPLNVVGCYRSHIGEGLSLSEEDFSLAQACCCESATVFLLIKPSSEGPSSAGLFLWEEGHIDSQFSFQEFTFDAQQLALQTEPSRFNDSYNSDSFNSDSYNPEAAEPIGAVELEAERDLKRLARTLPRRAWTSGWRAWIFHWQRRTFSLQIWTSRSQAWMLRWRALETRWRDRISHWQAWMLRWRALETRRRDRKPRWQAWMRRWRALETRWRHRTPRWPTWTSRWRAWALLRWPAPLRLRWYALSVMLVILLSALAYMRWAGWWASAPAGSDASALALRVERRKNDLRVSWNRNSPMVDHARQAVLTIRDGDLQPLQLHLDVDQLRNGNVLYNPVSARVQFQLELTARDHVNTTETVVALAAHKPGSTRQFAKLKQPAAFSGRSRKVFSPPPLMPNFGDPVQVLPLDPPVQTASIGWPTSPLLEQLAVSGLDAPPPVVLPSRAPLAGQANAAQTSTATSPSPGQLSALADYVAARAIYQVLPNLPPKIRATLTAEVEVRLMVKIDAAGRVVRAEPVAPTGPASSALVRATQGAARLWKFAPAMRGDEPIASEMVLVFGYRPVAQAN